MCWIWFVYKNISIKDSIFSRFFKSKTGKTRQKHVFFAFILDFRPFSFYLISFPEFRFPLHPKTHKMTEPDFSKIETAGCPAGDAGRDMILRMNREHGPLRAWGFAHIPVGRSMLDVGCGAGAALRELAELHPEAVLTGCDISPLAVETATALNEALVKAGRMRFLLCGVPDLPFDDDVFDTVFSVESLYFWPDQTAGLREIRRVLAPGGYFMTALEMVGGMMDERQLAIVEHLKMVCPTREKLEDLMVSAGFDDVKVEFEPEHNWLCAAGRK